MAPAACATRRGAAGRRGCSTEPHGELHGRTAVGRCAGSLARQASTIAAMRGGTPRRSGGMAMIRYNVAAVWSAANGPRPVAAQASVEPSAKTSPSGPLSRMPSICSGAMKSGVPMIWPVTVSRDASTARAIPKSITRGPAGERSTLAGLRSRWTSPAAWIAASASASPRARSSSACSGIGPCVSTASRSEGPSTNSVASHGGSPSGSASSTRAVNMPATADAAATSRRNRWRKPCRRRGRRGSP